MEWGSDRASAEVHDRLQFETLSDHHQVVEIADLVIRDRSRRHLFVERFTYQLRDVVFDPRSGVPFMDGRPLSESHSVPIDQLMYLAPTRPRPKEHLLGPATGVSGTSYYHWLLEQLPATLRAREVCDSLSVIRWTRSPEFVTTACELFFDASLSVDQVVSVGDYWLAGQGRDSGFPHPRDVEVVREATRDYRATSSEVRLFVPRSGFGRAPEGEERLASRLVNEHGFQVFDSTKKKWLEQIDLFSRAELVVGVHGGALSNLVFCQRNVRVIEILPLSRVVTCFANLARVLELDYRSLLLVPEHNNAYGDISTMEDEIIRLL